VSWQFTEPSIIPRSDDAGEQRIAPSVSLIPPDVVSLQCRNSYLHR